MFFAFVTNLSCSVFLTTSFLTTLLNFAKLSATGFSLSAFSLSTLVLQFGLSAKLLTSSCVTFFKSVFVA